MKKLSQLLMPFPAPLVQTVPRCSRELNVFKSTRKPGFSASQSACLGGREREKRKARRISKAVSVLYFKESLNKAPHIHLAHPLALLRKQQLRLQFVKWLMLQVKQ